MDSEVDFHIWWMQILACFITLLSIAWASEVLGVFKLRLLVYNCERLSVCCIYLACILWVFHHQELTTCWQWWCYTVCSCTMYWQCVVDLISGAAVNSFWCVSKAVSRNVAILNWQGDDFVIDSYGCHVCCSITCWLTNNNTAWTLSLVLLKMLFVFANC